MASKGKIGISGIDTRALTRRIRLAGAPNAVIAHDPEGNFDLQALIAQAQAWSGLEGLDLAKVVTRTANEDWEGSVWTLGQGYGRPDSDPRPHVVAIDFGAKDNIFRNLVKAGASVTVVPAETSLEEILALKPAGVPVERPGRSGGDRRICRPGDQGAARSRRAALRHLPWPPDAGPGRRRQDHQDAPGPSRRQPSGQAHG
jgi:carbamoylphosphate synthase small subunit